MNGKEAMSFLHDSNSRHDPKMIKLWTRFEYQGIGIFWCIVEILREQPNFKYSMDDIHLIGIELRVDKVLINDLIRYCLQPDVSLFIEEEGFFFSESLLRRMEKFKESHFRMSEGGKLGMKRRYSKGVSKVDISTLQGGYKVVGKVKEKKRNKIQSSLKSFLKPTIEEIRDYIQDKKYNINPEKWLAHYEANGWMVGKNHMKDWKAAIRTWIHNDFNSKSTHPAQLLYSGRPDYQRPGESDEDFDKRRDLEITGEPELEKKNKRIAQLKLDIQLYEASEDLDPPSVKKLEHWKKELIHLTDEAGNMKLAEMQGEK